jgi:hypothetical protein
VQSKQDSAPLPHTVSSVPAWQLPFESQQPLHDVVQPPPSEPLLLEESSPASSSPPDEPVPPEPEDVAYEPLLLAGRPESSPAAPESAPLAETPSEEGSPLTVSPAAHPASTKESQTPRGTKRIRTPRMIRRSPRAAFTQPLRVGEPPRHRTSRDACGREGDTLMEASPKQGNRQQRKY